MELFDFLNDISHKKKGVIRDDPLAEKDYKPYVINKFLSQHIDCILYVNEMNIRPHCDKILQFDYLINSLRKQFRRSSKWLKPDFFDDVEVVKEYFGYSTIKAKQALEILTEEQLEHIRFKLRKGGLKK
jgi:GTP-dependent phosphoenolpyruvate carboxykinase